MSRKKTTPARGEQASEAGDDLAALGLHLSEALRLSRNLASPDLYDALGEAVNDHVANELLRYCDTAEFIGFALRQIETGSRARKTGEGPRGVTTAGLPLTTHTPRRSDYE